MISHQIPRFISFRSVPYGFTIADSKMRHRTILLEIFSTFIKFSEDRFELWVSDQRLVRNMERRRADLDLALDSNTDVQQEAIWVLYWFRRWQKQGHPNAMLHLCAYLQEPCYWAAENITRRFVTVQCTLADGFQIAIAHLDRILKGYDPSYGSTLNAYARNAFGNIIRDQLRQRRDVNISSDWGLLRKLSQTQLKQALQSAGFTQITAASLVLHCFKAVCIPDPQQSSRGLTSPSAEQLSQMVERYNDLRQQVIPVPDRLDAKTLSATLRQSVQAARAYLTPAVLSLNQIQYDDSGKEWLDTLSGAESETPMAQLLAIETYTEQQRMMQQIGMVLDDAISALDPASQTLLQLYYRKALTQKDIALQLQLKQYQVSRKLSRVRQQLLLQVANWSQETLHISLDSTVIAQVSEVIHEWLQNHYQPDPLPDQPESSHELSI